MTPAGFRAVLGLIAMCLLPACRREGDDAAIRFRLAEPLHVSIVIEDSSGRTVRTIFTDEKLPSGKHEVVWDGKDDAGGLAAPGRYRWTGATHRGIAVKLRGRACAGPAGAERRARIVSAAPAAVAADDERVYLGWTDGRVVACDMQFHAVWTADLGSARACRGLAVDGGMVFALARQHGPFANDEIVRLDAHDGSRVPWPASATLSIPTLWPDNGDAKPSHVDGMCVRASRVYLTFTAEQFLAVLDAQSGAYLQTVVGAAPQLLDAAPTKTESTDRPGTLMDADFAVVALRGGVLGKVLFAHDPLWVITSDLQPLDSEERITALTLLGDSAKHHRHSIFVGLDAPFHQVQRRSVLDTQGFEWAAGYSGGRPASGPWNAEALGPIAGLALDAEGRLWVAEADEVPPRFSVWSTDGNQGRVVHEIFGPVPESQTGVAVLPSDPDVFAGGGCEWRLDPKTGEAQCLGVITRKPMAAAAFVTRSDGETLLRIEHVNGELAVFHRRGEGDYVSGASELPNPVSPAIRTGAGLLSIRVPPPRSSVLLTGSNPALPNTSWPVLLDDRLPLGALFVGSPDAPPFAAFGMPGAEMTFARPPLAGSVTPCANGRVHAAAVDGAIWNLEITGLDTVRRLPGGTVAPGFPTRR